MPAAWLRSWRLSRAKLALRTVTATIPEIERQIALKENEINTLLGRNPGPCPDLNPAGSRAAPGNPGRACPRRCWSGGPTFAMAEQQVRAANAEIGVAIGDFFPRIGLTTFYGGTSTELTNC